MAGEAVIGALRVVLGADSAALDKGLADSRASISKFGSDIAKAGVIIGAAMTAAYATVSVSIASTVQQMDGLAKQSQKIGIPVEQLSALKLAADVSGVSMETLGTGIGKLSKAMVEAAAKPTSEAANAFRALGVSVVDSNGKLRPVLDVTTAMAGKFENLKDGAGKTAVSMALLGRGGAELIPFLNQGADGLTRMMQSAQQFGIVIDSQTAAAASKFQQTLIMLGAAKDGIIVKLTAYLLPAMQAFAQRMLDAASNSDKQASKLNILKIAFDGLARVILLAADNFKILMQIATVFIVAQIAGTVLTAIVAFVNLARALQAAALMMAAFEAIRNISSKGILILVGLVAVATGQFENLASTIKDIGSKVGTMLPEGATETFSKVIKALGFDLSALSADLTKLGPAGAAAAKGQGELNYAAMAGKTAVDSFIDSTNKSIAAQQADFAATGMASGAKERLKIVLEGLQVASANHIVVTEAMRAKLTETANAADLMALKIGNIGLIGQVNPFAALQANLDATNLKLQQGGLNAQDYATLSAQAARLQQKVWADSATSLGGSFESIGQSMSQLGSNWGRMAAIGKAIGATIAFINSYVAASSALATAVFPANIAIAAGVLANGLAMVASIKSAAAPAMAMGGSFRVPGGVGGGDKVPFHAMLEPGEQVDITSNRAGGHKGPNAGGYQVIEMRGVNPTDFFTGKQLLAAVQSALGDGGRLVMAN